jgi:hypothetical protein
MPNILLKDILPVAQQESYRMRHYFMGVEHLFIAMLEMKGSIATRLIEENGYSPEYIINAVRLKIGKGIAKSPFVDFPPTPRLERILRTAEKIAVEQQHPDIDERDLLLAILNERDNLPVRVLQALQMDVESLKLATGKHKVTDAALELHLKIEYAEDYNGKEILKPYQHILKRMFHGYTLLRIDRELRGGHTRAQLYVVTPFQIDNRPHAAVVVKIGLTDDILDEARRYENHVKNTLPPFTARLEDKPTAPDNSRFAGLKYTLIVGSDGTPNDLRAMIPEWGAAEIGRWIRQQLYPTFGKTWWMQGRGTRLEVWREYDRLLPPILTLEYIEPSKASLDAAILNFPIRRSKLSQIRHGDIVKIENFTVQKIDHEEKVLTLALGNGGSTEKAFRIKIRNVDLDKNIYYRGEIIESITGQVWETRSDSLMASVRELQVDFNPNDELVPATVDKMRKVLNPLKHYETLLEWQVNGIASKTHGDMHLGNIMVGAGNNAFLIDFAHAREGHTAFDWACLEVSLLSEVVVPVAGEEWSDVRRVVEHLMMMNAGKIPPGDSDIAKALAPVIEVRRIMHEIMMKCIGAVDWTEYLVSLMMCALRAMTWETMSIGSRRLMFLLAGMMVHQLREKASSSAGETPSPDETEVQTRDGRTSSF